MREKIVIYMPKFGYATGEMPHIRKPFKNYMPGQNLYYLYSACKNLGNDVLVVDANWSKDPIGRILDFDPSKVLITSTTPCFEDALGTVEALRRESFGGKAFIGGPHVNANFRDRAFLLPEIEGLSYVPVVESDSTLEWIPAVFPGRSIFEALEGIHSEEEGRRFLTDLARADPKAPPKSMTALLFSYFLPSHEWLKETYSGDHVRDEMRAIPIRPSIITSIGCTKKCTFCTNNFTYRIVYKHRSTVRKILQDFKQDNISRISVHDMFFFMSTDHAREMISEFREAGMQFSIQTCLENLSDELIDLLVSSGAKKILVGVENPASYTLGKKVHLGRVKRVTEYARERGLEGMKLSYITGLPGASLDDDMALIHHIITEIQSGDHALCDLQVNLFTPYRPESRAPSIAMTDVSQLPQNRTANTPRANNILVHVPFRFWGLLPVSIQVFEDLRRQMVLCDTIYSEIFHEFLFDYLEARSLYVQKMENHYPELARTIPSFEESIRQYKAMSRKEPTLAKTQGSDAIHRGGRQAQDDTPQNQSRSRFISPRE
jgi:hypothetical protein